MRLDALRLTRPLAVFDLESSGRFPDRDRIVEITIVTLRPDGTSGTFSTLVNPTVPIPAEATAIHGITDEAVRERATFRQVAPAIARGLEGCDLAGYNVRRFDVPMLCAEFARAQQPFSMEGRRVVDVCAIFHKREPRDLAAVVQFFCGHALDEAHRADADVLATIAVLRAQLARYEDLPRTVEQLHDYCKDPNWIDDTGRVVWDQGVACLAFGKHAGRPLEAMAAAPTGRDYLRWLCGADFPADTKRIVLDALSGRFPRRPEPTT